MLTVIEPAASTALTTLDRVKFGLGIDLDDDTNDEFLEMQIQEQSDYVCALLNVAVADDGTRTLGLETVEEILEMPFLSRLPVVEIISLMDGNGTVYDPDDYRIHRMTGRFIGPPSTAWMNLIYNYTPPPIPIIARYTAGWLLPGDEGRTLPYPIETATVARVSSVRSGSGRDPLVKAEDIPGVIRTEYWVGSTGGDTGGTGGIPPDIWSQLSMYRRLGV
jgi:hypothetical protein